MSSNGLVLQLQPGSFVASNNCISNVHIVLSVGTVQHDIPKHKLASELLRSSG